MGEVGGSLCRGQPTKPPTGHHRLVALMTLAKEVDLVNVGNSALVKRYGVVDFAMQVGDRTKVGFKPSHLYCTLGWVRGVSSRKRRTSYIWAFKQYNQLQEMGLENGMMFCCLLVFLGVAVYGSRAEGLKNGTFLTFSELPRGNAGEGRNSSGNTTTVEVSKQNRGGGGGYGWGWGGGGGGGGGGGWGWGGGGGGWWKWGCGGQPKSGRRDGGRRKNVDRKRIHNEEDYSMGEFAECMVKGRCRGMRLDCPLHCGGPCFYDCRYMCKAHCRRRRL